MIRISSSSTFACPSWTASRCSSVIQRQTMGTYLPVIVVTADDSHESVERALAGGAHDFVSKPFNAAELVLRVRNLLLNRYAYKELRRSRARLRTRLDLFEPDLAKEREDPLRSAARFEAPSTTTTSGSRSSPIVDMRDDSLVGGEALARFADTILGNAGTWFAAALEVGLVD